eukprot:scaffold27333_cov73-Skeletonema_marinoi.AAC.1
MQEIYIRKARLTELNIYNDDPTKQLSRERTHNWINLCICAEDNDSPGVMELAKRLLLLKIRKKTSISNLLHVALDLEYYMLGQW